MSAYENHFFTIFYDEYRDLYYCGKIISEVNLIRSLDLEEGDVFMRENVLGFEDRSDLEERLAKLEKDLKSGLTELMKLSVKARPSCDKCNEIRVIEINENGIEWCQQCCNQWSSVSPMYLFEIPENFISVNESNLLIKSNEFNEFQNFETLWKEFRKTNINMMTFAFSINLFLEKSLKDLQSLDHPFVYEWESNLEGTFQSDVDNLIEQNTKFLHKSWEICNKISEQFENFMKSTQILTKFKEEISRFQREFRSINTIYNSIMEAREEFRNQKTRQRKREGLFNKLEKLKEEGDKILEMNCLRIKLEYIEEKLDINSNLFENALDFWKKLSCEFQENEKFIVENIKHGELCIKEYALNYIKENQLQIMHMVSAFCKYMVTGNEEEYDEKLKKYIEKKF